jgi:hypothetical protein
MAEKIMCLGVYEQHVLDVFLVFVFSTFKGIESIFISQKWLEKNLQKKLQKSSQK